MTPTPTTFRLYPDDLADLDFLAVEMAEREGPDRRGPAKIGRGDVVRELIRQAARRLRNRRSRQAATSADVQS